MGCMRWGSVLCVVVGVGASGGVLGQEFSPKLTGSATLEWGISYGKGVGSHGQAPGAVMGTGPYNLKHGFRTTNTVGVSFPLVMRTTHTRRGQHPALYAELKVADLQADLSQGKAGFAVKRKGKVEATLHCYGAYLTIGKNPTFLTNFARLWKPWVTAQYQEDAVQYAPGFGGLGGKVGYRAQDIGGSGVSLDVGFLSFASNGAWDSTDPTHSKYGFGADLKLMYARAGHPLCTVELASNVTLEDGYLIGAQKDANNQNKDKLLWNVGGRLTLEPGAGFRFSFALDAGNQHQSEATAAMRTERTRERAQEVALAIFTHAAQEQAKQAADTVGSTIDNSVQVARSVITQIAEGAVKQAHDQIKRTNGTQVVNIDVTVPVNVRQSPVRQPDLPSLTAIAAQLPNVTKLFFLSAGAAAARPIIGQITGVVQNVITQQVQARVAQSTAVAIQQVLVFNQQTVAAEKANTQKHTINGKSYAAHIGSLVSLATNRALPTIRQRVEQAVQENIRRINAVVQQKAQTLTSSQELEKAVYSLFVPTFENLVLGAGALLALLDMHQIAVDALFTAQWKWLSSGIYFATAPANVFGTRVLDNTIASCGDFAGFLKLETKSGDPYTHLLTGLDAGVETRVYIPLTHDLYKNNNGNPLPSGGSSGHIGLPVVGKAWCSYRIPVQDYGWVKPSVTVHASTNRAHLNAPAAGGAVGATYLTKEYCAQLRAGISASLIEKTVFSLDWEQGMLSDVPYLLVSECLTQGIGRIVCGVTLSW
ncbi:hypothetical protein N6M81_01570 [Treponema pallidum]|nr:hypothetical protein KEA69_01555 [Treponema pallidum]UXI65507.1 hypothetical protein N6M81_01570 [Treponema pallidum]